jgi:signal transduction histidine kinase
MKHVFTIFSFLCLFLKNGNCQGNFPPAYIINTDTAVVDTIPPAYWTLLADQEGRLTIDQVSHSPVGNQFHHYSNSSDRYDYAIRTYWFCFRLKNAMSHGAEIGFGVAEVENYYSGSYLDKSIFYFRRDGKWETAETGYLYPWKRTNGLGLNHYIFMVIQPGEELLVYNRRSALTSFSSIQPKLYVHLNFTRNTLKNEYISDERLYSNAVHNSVLFGILFFACLFSLLFYFIVKERLYLYFSLYVLCLGIGRMHDASYFVFLREHREWWANLFGVIWILNAFLPVVFLRSLLKLKSLLPRWDKILNLVNISNLVYSLVGILMILVIPHLFSSFAYGWGLLDSVLNRLVILLVILSFILVFRTAKSQDKIIELVIFPAFFVWGVGHSISIMYKEYRFITISKGFTLWVNDWWYYIETFTLALLVLGYSWELLLRFRTLQNELANQAIDKEKEKRQLIQQKRLELERTVEERTADLKQSLERLQSTQHQLVQSEKMASLGEMTAGIAHEIQNPLNFVNNFSDINKELIEELENELQQDHFSEARSLLRNIVQNEEKIAFHGKRADAIVKSMLMHSRATKGTKEPTNINARVDEYLRLSYHGFRAKDKFFHAKTESHLDPDLPLVNMVAQDMGRVILNLLTNAFYSVISKARLGVNGYQPAVAVFTKTEGKMAEIRIRDNGLGISPQIMDKIFNPFFTTKPGGEGTGLGLSLSYEIITKEHGGEITVNTKEGEFAEFIIRLPIVTYEPIVEQKPHLP